MAEPDAGQRLDLEIAQRLALRAREGAHLLLAEADVLEHLRRNPLEAWPRSRPRQSGSSAAPSGRAGPE